MFIKNILKGILFGIFSMLPGLSGGMLASFTGDYTKCISIFVEKQFNKESIIYMSFLIIGFIIGNILVSNILLLVFNKYNMIYRFMVLLINVLILLSLIIRTNARIKGLLITILLSTLILLIVGKIRINHNGILLTSLFYSLSKVVPGVSSTSLLINIGLYDDLLYFFSSPFAILIDNFIFWFIFWIMFLVYSVVFVLALYFINNSIDFNRMLIPIQVINIFLLL